VTTTVTDAMTAGQTVDAAAGQTDQDPDVTDADASAEHQDDQQDRDDDDHHDDEHQDDDQNGSGRRNREAGYRRRAQAAEAERDQIRAQLDGLHRQTVAGIATRVGGMDLADVAEGELVAVVIKLLETAGHEMASFITPEGAVDGARVIEATKTTMRRYNMRPRNPLLPSPQQGMRNPPAVSGGVAGIISKELKR
jgi:hypothetical protein